MNTIQSEWDKYYEAVLKPAGVVPGSVQFVETKRAFFAGSSSLYNILMGIVDTLSEEAAAAVLGGISEELRDFYAKVGRGR